ncbi:MAG: response regulator [Verrucomicrobia bacterium]|nr:response regulator [Verrucomicrobiota bacterium]
MASLLLPDPVVGTSLPEAGWFEPVAIAAGALAVGVLVWRLWKTQQEFAALRTESARELAAEKDRTLQAQEDKVSLLRENKAKSEMLATLSRDIRGHLNGIMGSADLLVDHTLKPRQREHLATLRASAESLHQSLNDVLDYSSIETGQIQIAHAPFELRQPLTEVVETVSTLALLKGLELVLLVAADVPLHVSGDAVRLRQILLNLTSNAVKFTAEGRVVLSVTLAADAEAAPGQPGTLLRFSVSDTGPSIPEDMHATIFDHPSDSVVVSPRNFGSAGLELAIVKRLVELMGGQIGARSLPEGGSEFWIVLALQPDRGQATPAPARIPDLHVVVLDGLAAARIAVSALLARLDIEHDATDTPAQAVEMLNDALEAEAQDLVLLVDETLARDRGAELAQALAAAPALKGTRVMLLSRDPDSVAPDTVKLPFAAILRKPLLRPEALFDALRGAPAPEPARTTTTASPFDPPVAPKPETDSRPVVLVVDDDNISRSVSSQLLNLLGCNVEVAVSGAAAIERTQRVAFDLIFMDCQMPEMDGFEATRRILAALGNKAPVIVALTANTSARDRESCLAAGMKDFIAKPVNRVDLTRILRRWTRLGTARAK